MLTFLCAIASNLEDRLVHSNTSSTARESIQPHLNYCANTAGSFIFKGRWSFVQVVALKQLYVCQSPQCTALADMSASAGRQALGQVWALVSTPDTSQESLIHQTPFLMQKIRRIRNVSDCISRDEEYNSTHRGV